MTSSVGAGVVAAFNFSSALGRLLCGFCSDFIGPLNTLFGSLLLSALSMLILWPVSTSIGPLIVFVIINGMSNGGFFSTMPTVVGNVFGSSRVPVAMGMVVTGWAGGYLLVRSLSLFYHLIGINRLELIGRSDRWVYPGCFRRRRKWDWSVSSRNLLCGWHGTELGGDGSFHTT